MNIKKNDKVVVLSGKDRGKQGKVLEAMPADRKVVVEGVNVATCHVKARKQGEESGIIRKEIPMYASKVMLVCPKCGKPTRAAHKAVDGKNVRVCKKCGETI
ncbi:MAG: 50S ribosomal protein L24 [Candidatus Avoscillospira sp.]